MNTKVAKDTIAVIRKERRRRMSRLPDQPDAADYVWRYTDEPFVNDLCLMVLVAIHHQVEREILALAARMTDDGEPLSRTEYEQRVQTERGRWRRRQDKPEVIARLNLRSFGQWDTSMETLRLLANSYKHEPSGRPDAELLRHLKLDVRRKYMALVDSDGLREGLAASLDLKKNADYCAIADALLMRADQFLAAVKRQPGLSRVKRGALSVFRGFGEY